jgi:hypothetical protein
MNKKISMLARLNKSEAFKHTRFSRANLVIFAIIFASIGGYLLYSSFAAGTGNFQVQGTQILDPNGNNFVPIGANVNGSDWVWSDPTAGNSNYAQAWNWNTIRVVTCYSSFYSSPPGCPISYTGCNAGGVPCDNIPGGNTAVSTTLTNIVNEYTAKHIVVMIDLQQWTGAGDPLNSSQLATVANFWTAHANAFKNNPYVWFNVLNEPTSDCNLTNWSTDVTGAVQAIRGTGAQNPIVLDGSCYGQDFAEWGCGTPPSAQSAIINKIAGASGLEATYGNIVPSVHMYSVYGGGSTGCTRQQLDTRATNYVNTVHSLGLPLIIGETGDQPGGSAQDCTPGCQGQYAAVQTAFDTANTSGIGLLWWHASTQNNACLVSNGNPTSCNTNFQNTGWTNINSMTAPTNLTTYGKELWDLGHQSSSNPPPTVTLTASPPNISPGGSSTLSWSSTNATSCSAVSPTGWTTSTTTSGTKLVNPSGTTAYTLSCTGAGGTTTASATVTINDTTPPTVSITAPLGGATVSGNVNFSANASDNVGVTKVEFYVDGSLVNTSTSSPYSFMWDTSSVSNGTHTLSAKAYDAANNLVTSTAVTVTSNNSSTTINDNTTGTGVNQFNYIGTWNYSPGDANKYQSDDHYSNTANSYFTLQFSGTSASVYVTKASHHGMVAFSVDGGAETTYDEYAANYTYQVLAYTTPTLTSGTHTIKMRVTGTQNAASTGTFTTVDKVVVNFSALAPKVGDINGDNSININDLSFLLSSYGQSTTQCSTNNAYKCDLSSPGDGVVNIFDLSILLSKYGT